MNSEHSRQNADGMRGLRVVALLPPSQKERTHYLADILKAAKVRWDWRINVVCDSTDRRPFDALVAPGGTQYLKPHLLRVQDWEKDPARIAEVEARMRAAEVATGIASNRIILAGGHSVGRAYNAPMRHTRGYALVRQAMNDNMVPYRIIRRLFHFADTMLEQSQADLVYVFDWATPLNFAIWFAAQRRGIACVALRYSKINANHAFWTTDFLMMNRAAIQSAIAQRKSRGSVSASAKKYIDDFRNQPQVISYIATKWTNRMRRGFWRWHLGQVRVVAREFVNRFRGQDQALNEPPLGRFFRYYHALYLSTTQQRFFSTFDDDALAAMKYIYFPLHKEAEIAQTFQAPLWHDQRNTVRALASALPAGYRLLVREHRMNVGYRPTASCRELSEIPNVTLIDPFDSQYKYIRNADLVVTENGSSGWEGHLLQRRVVTLAPTFYEGAGLDVRIDRPEKLGTAILDVLERPAVADPDMQDHALGCMIDGELNTTFPMTSQDTQAALDRLAVVIGKVMTAGMAGGRPVLETVTS